MISHEEEIIKAVIQKMNKAPLVCTKSHGKDFLKFGNTKNKSRSLSLRRFVFAKYNGYSLAQVRRFRIRLHDESLFLQDNILDIRRENLFNEGDTNTAGIEIIERPDHPNEKYLAIQKEAQLSIQEYNPELYEFLTNRSICNIQPSRIKRLIVKIHVAKRRGGYVWMNLAKLTLIYRTFRTEYKSLDTFKRRIRILSKKRCSGLHAAHVNSLKWNDCKNNLMFMNSTVNLKLRDDIRNISGRYECTPICYEESGKIIILAKWIVEGKERYLKFNDASAFLDFQQFVFGDMNTFRVMEFPDNETRILPLPKEQKINGREGSERFSDREQLLSEFWEWCLERDSIIKQYVDQPHTFYSWSESKTKDSFFKKILTIMT